MVDTTDEWIVTRTGIRERRIAQPKEACSDLALRAAKRALEDAKRSPKDLDGIIVGTVTGDMLFPATACVVQDRLNAVNAAAFDVGAACSGYIYGLNAAHALIATEQMSTVLVIGVDLLSKFIDWKDRATCVLFGDGAGAAVLEPCKEGEGILSTYIRSDGSLADLLFIPAGGSKAPADAESYGRGDHFIKMKGDGVFKYAVRAMEDATKKVLERANLSVKDLDLLIPHQANIRILDAVRDRLGLPDEKVLVNLDRYGNTSSATIPIAFDEAVKSDRLRRGDLVLMVTFGGGLTWGSVLLRYV